MTTRYRRPELIGSVSIPQAPDDSPAAYVAMLPAGPIHWLDPIGYLIWSVAVELEDEAAVIAEVASVTGQAADHIGSDVTGFLGELVGMGLLEQFTSSTGGDRTISP